MEVLSYNIRKYKKFMYSYLKVLIIIIILIEIWIPIVLKLVINQKR